MPTSTGDYFIALSNKLAETHKVYVVAGKIRDVKVKLNPEIIVLQWPSPRPTALKDFLFLIRLVRQYQPNLMISMFSFVNLFLIVGWLFRVKLRVAWIRTISSHYTYKKYKVLRKSFIYRLATNIITNSNATKQDVNSFFKIPLSKITVLPNSVIDYSTKLQGIDTNRKNLLYVGRLHPGKGVDVLIKAFSELTIRFPGFHLDIIGNGDILKALQNLANSLDVSDKVSFLGQKDKASVLRAYKKSYCTIIPSYSEAFGFTVIEAMSTGTCVIGANNTGIKEIIVPDETGLLFKTGNSEDLAYKLEKLMENLSYRNKLAQAGHSRFLELYENNYAIGRDANFFNSLS